MNKEYQQEGFGISISQKWGKIRIFRSVIIILGEPKYVRFLYNPQKRKLSVQACKEKTPECFRVPKYKVENWDFKISSSPMVKMLSKSCGWIGENTYRVQGFYFAEQNLMEFNLEQAVIHEEDF